MTWASERPGQVLAALRARTTIEASIWDVMAVLEDVNHACEWTAHCVAMRHVARLSDHEMLVYARMHAPWPVQDRDVVTRVSVAYGDRGELRANIRNVEVASIPSVDGVVRMPKMIATYKLQVLDEGRVEVEYQIDVDPGGSLPDWLKQLVARNLAYDTLDRLRDRTLLMMPQVAHRSRARVLEATALRSGFVATTGSGAVATKRGRT